MSVSDLGLTSYPTVGDHGAPKDPVSSYPVLGFKQVLLCLAFFMGVGHGSQVLKLVCQAL